MEPTDVTPNMALVRSPAGPVLYAYLTGRCHTANIVAWRARAEELAARRAGRVDLLLFVDTPATIGARGRQATTAFVDAMTGRVSALVLCLEANVLWRSMFRSAVSAGLLRSKRDYPVTIVGDLQAAAEAFASVGVSLDVRAAEHARAALRRAVQAPSAAAKLRGDSSSPR